MASRRKLLSSVLTLIAVVLAGGFAAAVFVRYSPGFDIDENSWNPRLSAATLEGLHARRQQQNRLPAFYAHYLAGVVQGDFGKSESLQTPVAALLRDRAPVTARLVLIGTIAGLAAGALLAWFAVWPRKSWSEAGAVAVSGILLAIPPAVLALGFYFAEAPFALAVALTIAPRVFGTMRALLAELEASPELLAARARGVSAAVIARRYVLGNAAPQLFGLAGIALVLAFGAIIPIEALCDIPGIGQLAWQAAQARDLPVLCALALVITLITGIVAAAGDLISGSRERQTA